MVMGGYSCSEGRGFNPSTVYWMDIFCYKNCIDVCLKKTENKHKEASDGYTIGRPPQLCGSVCTHLHASLGSNPKHNINAFSIYI